MTKIINLIKNISEILNEASDQKAWWIIEAITKKNKAQLLIEKNFELENEQQELLNLWLNQLTIQNKPLQYIIGHVPFLDFDILVEPPILIPRPETENWTFHLIEKLKLLDQKKIKILDIGTGTGCIAIALAKALTSAEIYAIDICDQALKLAENNIKKNKINNIKLVKSNLFEYLKNEKFDLIVSNPPYIDENIFHTLDLSVRNWEDPKALISSDKGLYLIKKIIAQSKNFLNINEEFNNKNIPQIAIEIDYNQTQDVIKYFKENNFVDIKIEKDIFNKDRVVTARR